MAKTIRATGTSTNLNLLSFYRTELMGLSAIGIICCHTQANGVVMPGWLWQVLSLGQLGVSLFFFLSGFGLWYSLHNIKRGGVINWYHFFGILSLQCVSPSLFYPCSLGTTLSSLEQ